MSIQKVVFILGAGASCSINHDNIPVMDNFFEKCLPYLENPKFHPTVWLAFAVLEHCRCFPVSHRHLEGAATYAIAMHENLLKLREEKIPEDSPEYKRAEQAWLEQVQLYGRLCGKEKSRIHENLEVVFAEAERKRFESYKTGDRLDHDGYIRLVFAVHYLWVKSHFSHLHEDSISPASAATA